jgi:CRISPR-associated protein Csm3
MKTFDILIRPDAAALSLGGYSAPRLGGDKATARDMDNRPVVPASALKGALRLELERLLRGRDGTALVCSANRDESDPGAPPCPCPICRLFGEPGRATGTLRLDDAVLAEEAAEEPALRPGVGVSRTTGSVVDKHLTFVETTGDLGEGACFRARARLVPRGDLDRDEPLEEDWQNLSAACAALRAIGGGKARGLGWVDCEVSALEEAPEAPVVQGSTSGSGSVTLRFEALAPLHFGFGRQLGFFQGTHRHAAGSTVRGALAFALLESDRSLATDPGFQRLFDPAAGASFGAARIEGDVASATRRKCRPEGHVFDDLVGELIRREAARSGLALAVMERGGCAHPGCHATKVQPSDFRAGAPQVRSRVRTLTALNRLTGTSMDRKLYSIEALEPRLWRAETTEPLILTSEVRGLDSAGAALLRRFSGLDVWLGGKRSKGTGRCRLTVDEAPGPDLAAVQRSIEALGAALREGWEVLATAAGLALRGRILGETELPLAIVLREPWQPSASNGHGEPALGQGPLGEAGLRLFDVFVLLSEEGRFGANEADRYRAAEGVLRGEEPPQRVAAAGSVYVYTVQRDVLAARLSDWLALGLDGSGSHRELGWGRFTIRGPETGF